MSRYTSANWLAESSVTVVYCSGYTSPAIAAKDMGAATTTEDERVLCDKDCAANIGDRTTTKSGLEYVVIVPGKGPSPPVGIQVPKLITLLAFHMTS
jgi:hypothetical protein